MGKTADLTVVQKTIIDTLHKEGKPQTYIAKEAGCSQSAVSKHVNKVEWKEKVWKKKMHNQPREPQPYEDCQAISIQEFGWTSQGMDWGWGQGIRATTHRCVKEFVYSCRQRRLTWTKEKNWTVAQWSKVLFSDESKFCISFGNQGPRVWRKGGEAHSTSCLKSSVTFPQSVKTWVQCHLLVLLHCGFWKPTSLHPFTKKCWSTSCFLLLTSFLKMLISFSSRIWHLPTLPKSPKVG